MGKRQIRISGVKLQEHEMELLSQPAVQVILRNRVVVTGKLLQTSPETITIRDMRLNQQVLPADQIQEVIYDIEAAW